MRSLAEIPKQELEDYVFPGTDAAVLTVNKKLPQSELEGAFGEISGEHRLYPTETGWKIKFPYWYIEELCSMGESGYSLDDFEREERGWDHEHCSFCHAHIRIGESAYTCDHEEGGVYVLCLTCADTCK